MQAKGKQKILLCGKKKDQGKAEEVFEQGPAAKKKTKSNTAKSGGGGTTFLGTRAREAGVRRNQEGLGGEGGRVRGEWTASWRNP